MQINLLKNLASELAESDVGQIIDILFDKKDVNEFLIAKKMNLTINQIRNILYKLSSEGLVTFIRKKDKRKGWYIYYWTLDSKKCLQNLEASLQKKIKSLEEQLKSREQKRYYSCKTCNVEVSEENALEHGFVCEECAGVYDLSENDKEIKELKAKIVRAERELKVIQDEIGIINEKEDKIKASKQKKEEKKKKEEREKKKKQRERERNKEKKKNSKKSSKKVNKKVVKKKKV